MQKTALILGAGGGLGAATTVALQAHGWQVRALVRNPTAASQKLPRLGQLDVRKGDAMRPEDVVAAATGADLILHAVNPPGYRNWDTLALPMLENSILAARSSGARLVFPGNVYGFGADAGPLVQEDSPQHPRSRKGAIRVAMERHLAEAAQDGVRSLIVRAGDFFGAYAPASWMATVMVRPGKPLARVVYPGDREVGHAWAYLPDLAEAIARLAERDADLEPHAVFHFGGHYGDPGIAFAEAIAAAANRPGLPIRGFPWPLVTLGAPFVPLFRELREMRYLWQEPLRLDNSRLVAFLGAEPHTPLPVALRDSLEGLGCLPGTEPAASPVVAGG